MRTIPHTPSLAHAIRRHAIYAATAAVLIAGAHADTFTTRDGKTYYGKVIGSTPASITVKTADSVVKIPLWNLPAEIQKQYNYDPEKAKAFRQENADKKQQFWDEWKRDRKRYWNNVKKERTSSDDSTESKKTFEGQ